MRGDKELGESEKKDGEGSGQSHLDEDPEGKKTPPTKMIDESACRSPDKTLRREGPAHIEADVQDSPIISDKVELVDTSN